MVARFVAGIVSVLLSLKAFFIIYVLGIVAFAQPQFEIPHHSFSLENRGHFLNFQLYHSEVLGSVIVQQQAVLHLLSSLEITIFKAFFYLALVMILIGVVAVLYLAVLGAALPYVALMLLALAALFGPSIWLISAQGIDSFWVEFLSFLVVLTALYLICNRFSNFIDKASKGMLMVYASQTGGARQLAYQLRKKNTSRLNVCCISSLTVEQISQYERVLFVVSTYGTGEPPDSAQAFITGLKKREIKASAVLPSFNILALGDRTYPTFCAFGHKLSTLLQAKGFNLELPVQEVDRMNVNSITSWWQQICRLVGESDSSIEIDATCFDVRINRHLNALRGERAAHHIRLQSREELAYEAGDLIAIRPKISRLECQQRIAALGWSGSEIVQLHGASLTLLDALTQLDWCYESATSPQALVDVLPPIYDRLYSIASYNMHYVDLLVREHYRQDGSLGSCSNYLCNLPEGSEIRAQLRPHESFRLNQDVPLIMIAAGTGIAPFRGFLQQKQAWQSQCEHWLIFGEQYAQHDDYFREDFDSFQESGLLTRVSKAWSQDDQTYVQMILEKEAVRVQEWVQEKGAQIYLCGSRSGFGENALAQLKQTLGEEQLKQCLHTDLY